MKKKITWKEIKIQERGLPEGGEARIISSLQKMKKKLLLCGSPIWSSEIAR